MGEGSREARVSTVLGLPLKGISLVLMTLQYSTFILVLHYSRVMPLVNGHRYLSSTAVFLNELIKLTVCLTIALYEISRAISPSAPATAIFGALASNVFSGDSWKLAAPALLYTIANTLQYVGLSNLDAATFAVTYQLKIITTALFSVAILRKGLSAKKWISLLLLMVGVAIVQVPNTRSESLVEQTRLFFPRSLDISDRSEGLMSSNLAKRSATYEGIAEDELLSIPRLNASLGLLAVIGSCICAGLAGVSFEKILKDSIKPSSIWVRNVQLAIYSIFPALFIGVVFLDGETIAKGGFFQGYNGIVWSAISLHSLGGIVAAFCIYFADNIAMNFATGISIVISTLASFWFFEFEASGNFILGTSIVLFATFLYSSHDHRSPARAPRPPPIRINGHEKAIDVDSLEPQPQHFTVKLPTTPIINDALTTSRPGSPSARHHSRVGSSRGYFGKSREG